MKFLVRQRWAYLLASLLMASHTLADQCTNVFSDAVGSYHPDGKMKIERNASIRNTDGILDFPDDAIEDKSNGLSCIVRACEESGSTTAELDLPGFKHSNSSRDFKLERNQIDILEAGQYDEVELKENTQVYFTTPNSEYRIDKLKVERNSFIYLAAGEYWIDSLELKENTQLIHSGSGTGPVVIYSNDVKFERNTGINAGADPSQLILISYDDIEIKENTQVKAIVYADDDLKMERNSAITGSVVAKEIEIKENAYISYSQASVANLELDGICEGASGNNPPDLVAHYAFEEASWSGNNSVLDSSGNNAHGSPVGNVASVLSNNQISCRAATFPSNTSVSDIDAIDTGIDLNDEVGTSGTIAFWFRSTEQWDSGSQDRRLFDASADASGNVSSDPYFYAQLSASGRIEFAIEDNRDADRRIQTSPLDFDAYEWVHLAFVYDVVSNTMEIWVNGSQVSTSFTASATLNGTLGDFYSLYFGDNRSTYVIGTDDSAYGEIDEAYIYRSTLDSVAINRLMNAVTTCSSPTPDPIAHWSFDLCTFNGSAGEVIDDINGYNGTALGGANIDEAGRFCQAATFYGNDEHLSIPHQSAFELGEGAISFWFKRNAGDNGDMGLFSKDSSGYDNGGHLTLWSTYNRRILVRHQHVDDYYGYNYYLQSDTLSDDEWHHVVYTWGSSGLALYVDNELVEQNTSVNSVGIEGNPEPIIMGADAVVSSNQSSPVGELRQFFDGSIDEMKLYAEPLSEIHVDEIYNQSSYNCINCDVDPVLESLWTFDLCNLDGSAGEILDTGNLTNHGTALGGPVAQAEAKFCQGIQFLGNDEHVNIPHNANYATTRGAVSFWYRRKADISGDMGLFSKDSGNHDNGGHLTIWSKSNKSIQVRHQFLENNSERTEYLDSSALTDGQWHHVMYTWGNNGLMLYVDNQLVDSVNVQADIVNNPEPIILGASAIYTGDLVSEPSALDAFFTGDLDDVRVYSTGQPDAADVAALYNQSPYACAEECDTTPVLESHWTGDLCSLSGIDGELLDIGDSNLENHGTAKGGAVAETSGKYCQAIEFGGDDEHVNIPHHANYATTQGGVAFWFRRNSGTSGDMGLFSKDSANHDDGGHVTIWSRSGKTVQVRHQFIENNTDRNVYLDSPALTDGEWHHVFYTWGASGMTLYIDNQLVDQESNETAGVASNPEPIILGASAIYSEDMASSPQTLDSFFAGDIDDVRFYSSYQPDATFVDDVYNLAPYTCTGCETAPLSWYQFEESTWNAANTVIDTFNNFNGSPVGGITPLLPVDPMSCQAMDVPNNDRTNTIDALDTGINPRTDIGSKGTISFWFKANSAWNTFQNSDRRTLFDASQSDSQRFYLKINRNGVIRFDMSDSNGDLFTVRSNQRSFVANEWVFIAVSWDLEAGEFNLYTKTDSIDYHVSSSRSSDSRQLASLRSLYVGDNRNNYGVRGVFSGSADGQIDNLRIYNFVQSEADIDIDKEDNQTCSTQIHHYELSFDPAASVCSTATLIVKACGDEACSAGNLVDAGSTVDIRYTDGGGDTNTIVSSLPLAGGFGAYDWAHGIAQTYTLSLANTSPSAEQAATCNPANCEITFDNVELQLRVDGADVPIPRQIAQSTFGQTLSVQATQACNNLPSNTPLELAIECVDPAVCASGVSDIFTVGGVAIAENNAGAVTNFTTINNDFDRFNGITLGDLIYHDAGRIRLHARVGTSTVSKEFVVAPADLQFTASINNPQVAGVDFGLTVGAVGSQGALLPGYQPGDIQMRVTRTVPFNDGFDGEVVLSDSAKTGSDTVLSNNAFAALNEALLAFANGQSTGYQAYYSEAGQVNLTVREHNYFGEAVNDNGTLLDLSAITFIPDYFAVTDSAPSLIDTCASFSYWGQPIPLQETTLTLQAFNALGNETRNFVDWDISLGAGNITEPSAVTWEVNGANVTGSDTIPDPVYDNQWQVRFGANLTFAKDNTPQIPASSPTAEVLITSGFFVHNDYADLCLQSGPLGACESYSVANISGANLRWGRLVLDNVFGGVDQNLNMTLRTEYLNASGVFITNNDDNCTQYNWSESGGDLALSVPDDSPDLTGLINDVTANGTLVSGASISNEGILLSAPGTQGGVIVSLTPSSADSWSAYLSFDANGDGVVCTPELFLQGTNANCNEANELDRPFATATFGQFRGNDRIIHWREVFR